MKANAVNQIPERLHYFSNYVLALGERLPHMLDAAPLLERHNRKASI